ncbi:peptide-methionine (R)-S-oxide reductase MsrB [Pelobium sp.]|nr:peptide-methionine (R)-S-oxide reductase MsrB [Pelobium sp.]MDA9554594.1 peptide-methionine (R)-S-oxide reductase MsrB [Pelobium sp.]
MKKVIILCSVLIASTFAACSQTSKNGSSNQLVEIKKGKFPIMKTEEEWKKILSPTAFEIMVKEGTEPPFKNAYYNNHKKGIYVSAATGEPLFSSDDKFDSGTGWPSFTKPINSKSVIWVKDNSYGMTRDEVIEAKTGLHLGHVFDDGPAPTGLRYCINSAALKFIEAK